MDPNSLGEALSPHDWATNVVFSVTALLSQWRMLDGVCPSNALAMLWCRVGLLMMMCGWSSHDCLVHGSVWVRLSPQLSGPHTCYCTSATVLLCGYLILVAIVDAWDCCWFLGLQAEASLSVNGDQSG